MKRKIAMFIGGFAVAIIATVASVFIYDKVKGDQIPEHLQLKASKSDILFDEAKGEGTVKYAYKTNRKLTTAIDDHVKKIAQDNNLELLEELPNERTPTSRKYQTKKRDAAGNYTYVLEMIPEPQYKKDKDQNWYEIDYATTTEAVYLAKTKPTFMENLARLIRPVVYADTFTTNTDQDSWASKVGSDGYQEANGGTGGEVWSSIRYHDGDTSGDADALVNCAQVRAGTTSNAYYMITRAQIVFDTSGIPDTAIISSSSLSVVFSTTFNDDMNQSIAVVTSTPTDPKNVTYGQFERFGSSTLSQALDLTSAAKDGATYNDFYLNALGLTAINVTGVSMLGLGMVSDITNSEPTWASTARARVQCYFAEQAGTSIDPKLTVVYSLPGGATPPKKSADVITW